MIMSNKVSILSFDVSSVSTGWALIVNGKPKKYGIIAISKKLSVSERLVVFKLGVVQVMCEHTPDIIVVEETYMRNVKTLKTLMQFIGVLNEASLTMLGKRIEMVSPNTVRSYFEVKTKEDAFEFTNKLFKLKMNFKEHNDITDAILQGVYYYKYNVLKESKDEQ